MQIAEKEREFAAKAGHRYLNKEDFKKYASELREKSAVFKKKKKILADLRQEVAIAGRTLQILDAQHPLPPEARL